MASFMQKLQQFDAYTKPLDDFRVKTLTGGAVTLLSTIVIILLVISELSAYFTVNVTEELYVDSTGVDAEQYITLTFDVRLLAIPCGALTVDVMDVSGAHQSDIVTNIWRTKLDVNGREIEQPIEFKANVNRSTTTTSPRSMPKCGSCYGAASDERKCCNTCDDVRAAYAERRWAMPDLSTIEQCVDSADEWQSAMHEMTAKHHGCRVHGSVRVTKVAGNFHIAPGSTLKEYHSHVHDLHSSSPQLFNTTHKIAHLSFGEHYASKQYPLDNLLVVSENGGEMHQYYVQVVPTMYVGIDEITISTHQFSVTRHRKIIRPGIGDGLPGFFVQYEFSPLLVKYTESRRSFGQFLVSLCAIVGGVFTVAGIVDALIYNSNRLLAQKLQMGKAS